MKSLPEIRQLPPRSDVFDEFEKSAKISVDVIVNSRSVNGLNIGRYIHSTEEWQIDGFHGFDGVDEWWPLPKIGTGNK